MFKKLAAVLLRVFLAGCLVCCTDGGTGDGGIGEEDGAVYEDGDTEFDDGSGIGDPDVSPDDNGDPGTEDDGPVDAADSFRELALFEVVPAGGGASVSTQVALVGDGFGEGLTVTIGGVLVETVTVISPTEALTEFQPVPLTECGAKDVQVALGDQQAALPGGFVYFFDEDPIVFVHGYAVGPGTLGTMIDRFGQLGYPDDYLNAIRFSSSIQSNIINARDELPSFVDQVLSNTGAEKVDMIVHSMGAMSTRLWIKLHGGQDEVRDYVSLSGTHHGSDLACLASWLGEAGDEQCPAYATLEESHNEVQWLLNGDPDLDDVDESPFGVEDGGGIYYNALRTEDDLIDIPPTTCCLNQKFREDCTDPVNVSFSGISHMGMLSDEMVFDLTVELVRAHNASKP